MRTTYIPKIPDSSGVETYGVDYQTGITATQMHWHGCVEVIYIIKTDTQIFFNNQWNTLHEDDMILIPPGRIHYCRCMDENAVRIVIGIGEKVISSDDDVLLMPFETDKIDEMCIFRNVSHDGIGEKMRLLCEYESEKPAAYTLLSQALLMQLYAYVYGKWAEAKILSEVRPHGKIVRNITKILQEDIVNAPTAYEMADNLKISYSYLSKLLRESLNTSYGELLNRLRVDAAKKMLLTTEKSITEVGYDCGFCDSSYFIKIFGRYSGVTPRRYRENGLK